MPRRADLPDLLGNVLLFLTALPVCLIGTAGALAARGEQDLPLLACWVLLGVLGVVLAWCGLLGCMKCLRGARR